MIPRELPNVRSQSIDVPVTAAGGWQRQRVVRQLLAEFAEAQAGLPAGAHAGVPRERIIAYRNSDRWVQHCEPAPLPEASSGAEAVLRKGGTYLITGGLGGLGLELAECLCRSAGANVVLVGRTSLQPRGEWERWLQAHPEDDPISEKIRRVRQCEAAGGSVLVLSADVADAGRMRAVIKETHKRFGAIHGVIHAAGTLDDGLIQLKTAASAAGVLAPKVKGTLVLDEVLRGEPLDFFALFSSVSSLLGLEGQVDYAAANAFLDSFAASRSATGACRTVAINWGAWQEVGMAARADRKSREARTSHTPANDHAGARPPQNPWLERREDTDGRVAFSTTFRRSSQWVLGEHAVRGGDALIPGTGFLELARAALAEVEEAETVELSSVIFESPFVVAADETKELILSLEREPASWAFAIRSGSGNSHVTGRLAAHPAAYAAGSPVLPGPIDLAAITAACNAGTEVLDGFLKQSFMDFGRRWANVRQIQWGKDQALLTLELPAEFAADLESFRLHPALLDMATGGAQRLIPGFDADQTFYVPFSYGRLVLWKGLPRQLHSWVRLREANGRGLAVFDVILCDPHGAVVAEISEFAMKLLPGGPGTVRGQAADAGRVEADSRSAGAALRNGIVPREGIEAFRRILASGVAPQVVVSSVDLDLWMRQTDSAAERNALPAPRPGGERSTAGGGLPSGSDRIERRLAELYSQILGVKSVGLRDDFFDLGGHSLLAVRLLTRIEKQFQKAVPLPVLFQSPTVEGLAKYLRGDEGSKQQEPNFIVPLNEHGDGPAFFCVHSVGGEAVSFRHLSRLLGPEQRFYGIAPPPELRTAEFASSIEAMARRYVDALVAFQPEGPYLLGGWSAGSPIALEMAQLLQASDREVKLLIALDGTPGNTGDSAGPWDPLYYWKLLCNVPHWVRDDLMLDFSFSHLARRVWKKVTSVCQKSTAYIRGRSDWRRFELDGFLDTSAFSDTQTGFMRSLYNLLFTYVPKPYAGRVLLYRSTTHPLHHLLEVEAPWRKIAAELEVVPVRGTHVSIVREPYVRALAADLRQRLARLHTEPVRTSPPAAALV